MPFVDPQTIDNPTAGQPATAAWGDAVRNAAVYLVSGKPRARVYNSIAFAVTTATQTPVTFDSERYDTGACHSTVSQQSRLVVPASEGGTYAMGGSIAWAGNAAGVRELSIRVNGLNYIAAASLTF